MGLFINTNVAALNAQRNLLSTTTRVGRSFQRLSSGLRINSAKDDAAGLAISTRMTSQVRGLNQAVRNTNDAISLSQTAEGALQETTNILQRMRELAVQSANDTNTQTDRESIQAEIDQLIAEVDRIATTTQFNNQNVLDGSFSGANFHVGANSRETIALKTTDTRANIIGRQARYDGNAVSQEAFDQANVGAITINNVTIRDTVLADDTVSTTGNSASAIAKAAAINDSTEFTDVRAIIGQTEAIGEAGIQATTLDSANNITINGELITGFEVQLGDADDALVNAINAVTDITGVVASLDQDQQLRLVSEDGRNIEVLFSNAATATNLMGNGATRQEFFGTLTLQSERQISLGLENAAAANALGHGAAGTELLGINSDFAVSTIDMTTRLGANEAIEILDVALGQVSSIRSDLGAVQNRLESTISNLSATSENITASRSRIMDADFAEETSMLSRNQIIQQAGISILAQANQQSQVVLSLLG